MVIASVQKSSIHLGFYIYYNIFQPSSFYDAHILWTIVVIFYSLTSVSFSLFWLVKGLSYLLALT